MTQYQIIKAAIEQSLSTEEIEQVAECKDKILTVMAEYPGIGNVALALIGAKLAQE
jgi:antibiotic biosynthesis monooxygenase (ABM) superfamily enzyme